MQELFDRGPDPRQSEEWKNMTDKKLHRLVLAALFTALTTVMTMVIQVPSPMQGYVNLGGCAREEPVTFFTRRP